MTSLSFRQKRFSKHFTYCPRRDPCRCHIHRSFLHLTVFVTVVNLAASPLFALAIAKAIAVAVVFAIRAIKLYWACRRPGNAT